MYGRPCTVRLIIVDLRSLKFAAVIDVDRLPLREEIVDCPSTFTMSVAGLFDAAKGEVSLSPDCGCIDIRNTGLDITHRNECLVDIPRVD